MLVPLVALAAILGDSVGYELGRLLQKSWFLRYGKWIGLREPQWQRLEDFFHRHGGKTVFFARFSAFFRILVPFFAGAVRLRYLHFLKWNIAGGLIWAICSVLLGYVAGASWRVLHHWVGRGAGILVLLVIAAFLVVRFVRQRARTAAADRPEQQK
jgi:membrane-associated protein